MQDGRAHVNFPATSPYVLAVGGATPPVRKSAKGASQVTETVLNEAERGRNGGGVSDVTPCPSWQTGKVVPSVNPGNFAGRAIPDVAADADPATGHLTMSGGKMQIVGAPAPRRRFGRV
jgi:kumamolisin